MSRLSPIPLHVLTARPAKSGGYSCMAERIPGRIALGADPKGLGVACDYCLPALVSARSYHDGRPCCTQCATLPKGESQVPRFVWGRV